MKRLTVQRKLNRLTNPSPFVSALSFGAEHDAVHLCKAAANLGWRVTVVAPADESKDISFLKELTISSLQRLKL